MSHAFRTAVAVLTATATLPLLAGTAAHAERAETRRVTYGDVVEVRAQEPVTLSFTGKAGQRVMLVSDNAVWTSTDQCEEMTLRHDGTVVQQGRARVWTLPGTGRYDLDFSHACVENHSGGTSLRTARVQLNRLVIHRLRAGGPKVELTVTAGKVHAASFRLGSAALGISAEHSDDTARDLLWDWDQLVPQAHLRPGGAKAGSFASRCFARIVKSGVRPLLTGHTTCSFTAHRGRRYLAFTRGTISLGKVVGVSARIDGSPVELPGAGPVVLTFKGMTGQAVYLDRVNLDLTKGDIPAEVTLYSSRGKSIHPAARVTGPALWRLPATGTYHLVLPNLGRPHRGTPSSARLRRARVQPMEVNTQVALSAGGNRWTFAPLPEELTNHRSTLTVHRADGDVPSGWTVRALDGDTDSLTLSKAGTTTQYFHARGVLIQPGDGNGQGTITVSLADLGCDDEGACA